MCKARVNKPQIVYKIINDIIFTVREIAVCSQDQLRHISFCFSERLVSICLVMHDIVGTMFNKRFMEELFKPQDTYSKKAMRTVFDRLAHASIMRLNSASMDKVRKESIKLVFCLSCSISTYSSYYLRRGLYG